MNSVQLSRAFFGTSLAFHIIFATLGIGLSLMILLFELMHYWKKDSDYAIMAKRWTKVFAILLGVAIPSGTIVGTQISLLWPGFAKVLGQVIAVPFQIEIFAFFLEALFMSIYVYAADKLSPFLRILSLFIVMLGATLSGVLITSANTWMNTPAGFSMSADGTIYNVRPWEAFFNPSFFTGSLHVVITAFAAGAGVVASIAAYKLLKNSEYRETTYHKKGLRISLLVTFLCGVFMWVSGHASAVNLHEQSPEKLAAAEGLFDTKSHAPLVIGGVVDPGAQRVKYGIEVPLALSILAGFSPNTVVKGLKDFPQDTWPPFYTHVFFDLMVGVAALTTAISGISLLLWYLSFLRQRGLPAWLKWLIVAIGPFSLLGIEFGWIFSCSGRQPWVIYGFQRTTEAATHADFIGPLFMLFIVLYLFLGALTVIVLRTFFRRNPLLAELDPYGGEPS
ncbi:cytochrome ubiquinol oxidase subunit I [Ectobacillus polymachus]|uniref:cytochrome ubiquinol oxidase subunit I n=1 Tax=Ectobacillus polymachus TaxID=1508806 RepID=UPI003A849D78